MRGDIDVDLILRNSNLYDLDLFFFDSKKIIHIATAGMTLKKSLLDIKFNPQNNISKIVRYRRRFSIDSNSDIVRDNLLTYDDINPINEYKRYFERMSRRGFYSYDKVDIDDPDNYDYQLISKPIYDKALFLPNENVTIGNFDTSYQFEYSLDFMKAKEDFPERYSIFNLLEFIY